MFFCTEIKNYFCVSLAAGSVTDFIAFSNLMRSIFISLPQPVQITRQTLPTRTRRITLAPQGWGFFISSMLPASSFSISI